tara:strand:- start:2548 stop:3834 length:1287 start_codon:yes stop_codon:yes gene_type:complete
MNLLKLLSSSSLTLGISFIIRFALTVLLARFLSASELGIYSWVVTVFGIAGIITNFGADLFLIKKVPEYRNSSTDLIGSVIWHTKSQSIKIALVLILIILPISYFSSFLFDAASLYNSELMIIIFALPFAAVSIICSTSLRAFDFPIRGQFIESIVQTGTLFLLVLISFIFFNDLIPSNQKTLFLVTFFVFSWILSCSFSFLSYKKMIKQLDIQIPGKEKIKKWRREQSSIVIGILGWSFLGRSDIFLLAFLVSPAEVGAYFICLRLAEILMFFQTVAYYVWGGEISNLIHQNKLNQAQSILKKSSQLCISTTLAMTCFAFILAEDILFLVNERYVESAYLFKIALVTFFIKGASGMMKPLYYILGEQDFLAKCQWTIGLFFTTSVLITVPIYGLIACITSFAVCEFIYLIILLVRLNNKHNLSLSPL